VTSPGANGRKIAPTILFHISVYAFAVSILWNSLHPLLLPLKIEEFAPEALKNTYITALMTFGLILAMIIQPIFGSWSDKTRLAWGRRRPFILVGGGVSILWMAGIPNANTFLMVFLLYTALQLTSNAALAAYQGLIPDLVPKAQHGIASGAKNFAEILGVSVGAFLIARLAESRQVPLAYIIILGIWFYAMLHSVIFIKEPKSLDTSSGVDGRYASLAALRWDFLKNRDFAWLLLSRLLFIIAITAVQVFALFFLKDGIGLENYASATGDLITVLGVLILVLVSPAGYISDRVGRKPLIVAAGALGATGVLLLLFAREYVHVLIAGGFLGACIALFLTGNWALATEKVPESEAGRFMGLTNLATAGGAAISRLFGPGIDLFNQVAPNLGYQVLFSVLALCFVAGGLLTLKVSEPSRAQRRATLLAKGTK